MVKIEHGVRFQGRPSKAEMQRRWALAIGFMKEHDLDYLVTQANDPILCQYVRWFAETRSPHYTYLLFDRDGEMTMISHGAKGGKAISFDVGLTNNIAIPVFNNACYGDGFAAEKALEVIQKKGCKKLGFIGMNMITVGFYHALLKGLPQVETVDVTNEFDYLVADKSQEELSLLREACVIHDNAVRAIPSLMYAGRLEREFGADLYRLAMIAGADEYLSNLNVCSQRMAGPMFALHNQNKIMEEGDSVNVLFEVPVMSGYYADLHRYFNLGNPAPEMVEVSQGAIAAQDYIASICKPGIKGKEIFEACNEWLVQYGFDPETRLCGHGQGYGLVERPYFDAFDDMELRENMYLSIHPTVKTKYASVCPSDNYIVTKAGAVRVTGSERGLIIV